MLLLTPSLHHWRVLQRKVSNPEHSSLLPIFQHRNFGLLSASYFQIAAIPTTDDPRKVLIKVDMRENINVVSKTVEFSWNLHHLSISFVLFEPVLWLQADGVIIGVRKVCQHVATCERLNKLAAAGRLITVAARVKI